MAKKGFWQRLKEVFIPPAEEAPTTKPTAKVPIGSGEKEPESPPEPKKGWWQSIKEIFIPKKKIFITETKKKPRYRQVEETEKPEKEREYPKPRFVKEFFTRGNPTVHDLISEIKNDTDVTIRRPQWEINQAVRNLNSLKKAQLTPLKKQVEAAKWMSGEGADKNLDKLKKDLKRLNEIIEIQRNEISMMKGEDFFYKINTHFKTHSVRRSFLIKQDGNSFFLNLLKKDIKEAIKILEKGNDPLKDKKLHVLRDKMLETIRFNLQIDSVRNVDINKLDKTLASELEAALDKNKENKDRDGKYIIQTSLMLERINLFE